MLLQQSAVYGCSLQPESRGDEKQQTVWGGDDVMRSRGTLGDEGVMSCINNKQPSLYTDRGDRLWEQRLRGAGITPSEIESYGKLTWNSTTMSCVGVYVCACVCGRGRDGCVRVCMRVCVCATLVGYCVIWPLERAMPLSSTHLGVRVSLAWPRIPNLFNLWAGWPV